MRRRVAIVLGAAVRPDGTASPTLDLRVRHAVDLWRRGHVDAICLTGGRGGHGPPEAQVARDLALSLDVPPDRLLAETQSANTHQNILGALTLLRETDAIMLVSNRWHLPRAWLIARLMGRRAALSGPPGRMTGTRTMAAILREVAAMPNSALRALRSGRRNGR
ncbi:YdcF family protein [Jannaschia sp. S6380]|uniref:YdcF family protein n=1 Tax=Jannaschia sp. S6380 TaxID=2926408 RepID=UPI001FF2916B|nr:YdcF family protein [Jannaschia sp. S6380]MCK0168111.1 YdcF family protein [Jannaschia sp. S6380]